MSTIPMTPLEASRRVSRMASDVQHTGTLKPAIELWERTSPDDQLEVVSELLRRVDQSAFARTRWVYVSLIETLTILGECLEVGR